MCAQEAPEGAEGWLTFLGLILFLLAGAVFGAFGALIGWLISLCPIWLLLVGAWLATALYGLWLEVTFERPAGLSWRRTWGRYWVHEICRRRGLDPSFDDRQTRRLIVYDLLLGCLIVTPLDLISDVQDWLLAQLRQVREGWGHRAAQR